MNSCGFILAMLAILFSGVADAGQYRSYAAKRDFKAAHPCPANGKTKGSCPGYVMDHVKPLCAGGADDPSNMQWQTLKDSKKKDKVERRMCSHKKAHQAGFAGRVATRAPVCCFEAV